MRSDIREAVTNGIADILAIEAEDVEENSYLVDDLGLDSLALMELVLTLRQSFGPAVHDGEVKNLLTALDEYLPEDVRTPPGDEIKPAQVTQHLQVSTLIDLVAARLVTAPATS